MYHLCQISLLFHRDKNQLMIFIQGLYHPDHLPDDVTIQPSSPTTSQIEGAITQSIQSMKQELVTQVSGLSDLQTTSTLKYDNDGDDDDDDDDDVIVMETDAGPNIDDAARKMTDFQRKFKAEQLQLKDGGSLVISKENLKKITVDNSDKQKKTDSAVRTLSRNVNHVSS